MPPRRGWGVGKLVHLIHTEFDTLVIAVEGTGAEPVRLKADGSSHLLSVPGHGPRGERVRAAVSIVHAPNGGQPDGDEGVQAHARGREKER